MCLSMYGPLPWYQESMIQGCLHLFWQNAANEIVSILCEFLPYYDRNKSIVENCILGGSASYNALIERTSSLPLMIALQNHNIEEKYAFLWVKSSDYTPITQSLLWFNSREICHRKAIQSLPANIYDDEPILLTKSNCKHISLPPNRNVYGICNTCFTECAPQNWKMGNFTFPELGDWV